ncbi:thiamine kinase-like enzyme [Lentzea nigeriaca]|nr:thiamine kinase-like enzyme [Lentzea nigeriaca]
MVVTHGEPHPGNLIRTTTGFYLVDWDTVGMAVPERDLSVLTDDPAELTRYRELTGHERSADALRLYRLRWYLYDLVDFVDWFREPHTDDPDTMPAWTSFRETLTALQVQPHDA